MELMNRFTARIECLEKEIANMKSDNVRERIKSLEDEVASMKSEDIAGRIKSLETQIWTNEGDWYAAEDQASTANDGWHTRQEY